MARQFDLVKCRYCEKMIVFGSTADGKKIPMDPTPPVYIISTSLTKERNTPLVVKAERDQAMVTHFATCKGANQANAEAALKRGAMGEALKTAQEKKGES